MTGPTHLLYQHDQDLSIHETTIASVNAYADVSDEDKPLFKKLVDEFEESKYHVVTVPSTIFYAQGGGQPSDTGTMTLVRRDEGGTDADGVESNGDGDANFQVLSVRHTNHGEILHFGQFERAAALQMFQSLHSPLPKVLQQIDKAKRYLHCRIHSAGHIIGLAVRIVQRSHPNEFPKVSEGKASHFPDIAGVEFGGLIEGRWKGEIEAKANEIMAGGYSIAIKWWSGDKTAQKCPYVEGVDEMARAAGNEPLRIVDIVDAGIAGAYPCGGTHVHLTSECGPITLKKISRSKGVSRISYAVAQKLD